MAGPNEGRTEGAAPKRIHIEQKRTNWLPWLALLLGLLALLFGLSRCDRDEPAPTPSATATATGDTVVGATSGAAASGVLAGTAGLGTYLAGSEPAPRTFTFEKLNFDSGRHDVRAQDAEEIAAVAAALKQYPTTSIRIAGYADARGADATNLALGKARADSVKAALVAHGIEGERIATGSGGERDPVDTNATASGQAENRRTELVVTTR